MSIWGYKPSENDDAADWLTELEESPSLGNLEEAIAEITDSPDTGYFEIPECCQAVAASHALAELFGVPSKHPLLDKNTFTALKSELDKIDMRKKRKLLTQALAAIEFIMDDQENSELRQVLEEDKEDFDAWIANMKDLKANLSKIVLQVQD